ncbi:hypothetical protein H6G74_05320 [Nostoc spongiaeforme FACHB-130]|uniref:Uncharacterized protein n=1 Tax=Nostoc spongiaeforme FACHB-130 TaxID=1357510 RepID=A0ABR8FQM7_9NOSO|nr:hypothetical protein [Nostoc spongiaeforme]MBD2593749.1 hypothetical protein [Nostoc spongiaeforme FACHB-130]
MKKRLQEDKVDRVDTGATYLCGSFLVDFLTRFGYHSSRNAIASNYHQLNYEYNSTYTTYSPAL